MFKTLLATVAVAATGFVALPAEAANNPVTGAYCSTQMSPVNFRQCMGVAHLPETGHSTTWHENCGSQCGQATTPAPRPVYQAPAPVKPTLAQALRNAGVPVNYKVCADDGSFGVYRYFTSGRHHGVKIDICTNVATTASQQAETLRHEAVHAAQHCRSDEFDTVMTDQWLRNNVTREIVDFVTAQYDEADWLFEVEAFALENSSNQTVADLVTHNCG